MDELQGVPNTVLTGASDRRPDVIIDEIPRQGTGPLTDFPAARAEAESRFPFIKKFRNVHIGTATGENKRGLGEFHFADDPTNPFPGQFAISVGSESKNLPGGVSDTIIADMVHAASALSPEFQGLKRELIGNFSDKELNLARGRFIDDFQGITPGSNFEDFDSFINTYWSDGIIQDLLLPKGPKGPSEIEWFKRTNPKAIPTLNKIEKMFKGK